MSKTDLPAVLVAHYMQKQLNDYIKDHKSELMKDLGPGDSLSGRYDLDGQELPLGKATRTEPKAAWKVTDPDALLEWAVKNKPELTETQTVLVKPAVEGLLKEVHAMNAAITDDGEMIPGISWDANGGSYVRFTPAKDMGAKLALLANEGKLAGLTRQFLQLEPGDE
ncbi:hypothetical protein [Kocuria massiliensis]|uniref:hypothetical protein n=1 Tax=Kocuria massiliensis TaxID=1926282 RepID=UPI0022B9BB16|nr:hypothetical protein [Kocuria massiliensis]